MGFYLPIIGILVFLKGRFLFQFARFLKNIRTGKGVAAASMVYQRLTPNGYPKILIIGDSTAVGTGADDPEETIAGYFAQDFPNAHISNLGENGMKTGHLRDKLSVAQQLRFDFIAIMIGGNDVVRGTKLEELAQDLPPALDQARSIGKNVLLMTQGNIGNAPIFPGLLYQLYTRRARRVRDLFMKVAREKGIHYLDVFVERKDDRWIREPKKFYSVDWFHPNGRGYREWYEKIREHLTFDF